MKDRLLFVFFLTFIIVWSCGREAEAQEMPGYEEVRKVLVEMTPSVFDNEATDEREARLALVSHAIVNASRNEMDVAILLTLGRYESWFAEYVGTGCHYPKGIPKGAGDCDKGRSRSYWQMKKHACRTGWRYKRGSKEALFAFALCARRQFRGALGRCRNRHSAGYWAGGFSGYAKSTICTWRPAAERARSLLYYKSLLEEM